MLNLANVLKLYTRSLCKIIKTPVLNNKLKKILQLYAFHIVISYITSYPTKLVYCSLLYFTVFIAGEPAETVILQVRRTDQDCPVGTFSLTMGQPADGLTRFSCGAADNTLVSTQAMGLSLPLQVPWTPPTYNAGTLAI